MKRHICSNCSKELANRHSLCRHKKRYCKFSPGSNVLSQVENDSPEDAAASSENCKVDDKNDAIPTFDGNEFDGKKSKSVDTVSKIMEMLNIPKEKIYQIAKGEVCDRRRKRTEDVEISPAPPPAKKSLARLPPATEIPSPNIKPLDVTDDESEESEDEEDESEENESIGSFSHNDHRKREFSKGFGCSLDVEEKQLLNQYIELFRNMKEYGENNVEKLCTLLDRLKKKGIFDDVECQEAFDAIRRYSKH